MEERFLFGRVGIERGNIAVRRQQFAAAVVAHLTDAARAVPLAGMPPLAGFVAKRFLAGEGIHYEPRWFKPWPVGLRAEVLLVPHHGSRTSSSAGRTAGWMFTLASAAATQR